MRFADSFRRDSLLMTAVALVTLFPGQSEAADGPDRQEALQAMRRASAFFRDHLAVRGGYVYFYSVDLRTRYGEGIAGPDQVWVQPPGTPTVGLAFVRAWEATHDKYYLRAATKAAEALVYGQLQSGGWTNLVDFNPRGKGVAQYRNGKGRGKNNSTLDDGISQSAIRLLMHVDRAHEFNHQSIHDSARVALDALLKAQFPNGAFPQVWTKPVTAQPVKKPKYPDYDWRTEGRIKEYWNLYTLNDGVAGYVAGVLIDAHRIYGHRRYLEALRRLGDFLVLAQMPDPQPAWAQQYNYEMVPVWARRFEPAAIAGRESQDVMETLMRIYRHTGDARFLKPIPRALNYLRSSQLKDGRLARYYELRSNRPLYMTRRGKNYLLTYDDSRLPGHYGWKVTSRLDQIERDYRQVQRGDRSKNPRLQTPDTQQVARAIAELDEQGRWISTFQGEPLVGQPKFARGTKYISSAVFSQRLELLSRFVSDR